ncbi:MAG: Crp/Fnr family transcriptional regulator [Pseudomonadota bacterium]
MQIENSGAEAGPLARSNWFSSRTLAFRKDLLAQTSRKYFKANDTIYGFAARADGAYGVLSGSIRISIPSDDGQEFIAHREGQGFWFGDLAVLSNSPRLITVAANEDTECLFVPETRINQMVSRTPQYFRDFYALTQENMQTVLSLLANLGVSNSERRLILRLLFLEEKLVTPGQWIPVSQSDLAEMTAISLPTVQRILRRLCKSNLVDLGYSRLRIGNRKALLRACQS